MTDLIFLINPDEESTPAASRIRDITREQSATIVSVQIPTTSEDGLDITEFSQTHYQHGINLHEIGDGFALRDILLIKSPKSSSSLNFILIHVWNWPDSTYDIDAVRIPYEGETDPRNNPKGKNPGNIWAFSEQLNDNVRGKQATLFDTGSPNTVADGHLEYEGVERLIKCHTTNSDTVHIWGPSDDTDSISNLASDLGRSINLLSNGESDEFQEIPVLTEELPIGSAEDYDDLADEIEIPEKCAEYRICDCRDGILRLPDGSVQDMVTSPPYNIAYDPFNVPKPDPATDKVRSPLREGYEDDLPAEKYNYLLQSTFEAVDEKMDNSSADAFVNIKNNYSGGDCRPPFWLLELIPDDWRFSDLLVWRYDISYDPAKNKYKPYYEWIFRFTKGEVHYPEGHKFLQDYYIPILKGNSTERENLIHPAIYPKKVVKTCLEISDHTGLVIDPFLGSGTTLAAARELGRPAFGFEKKRDYEQDIKTRLEMAKPPEQR